MSKSVLVYLRNTFGLLSSLNLLGYVILVDTIIRVLLGATVLADERPNDEGQPSQNDQLQQDTEPENLVGNSKLRASSVDESNAAQLKFFEDRIRPVLVEHCYACHGADAKIVRGGLLLDSREGLLIGGDSGPAVTPGKPAESLLLQAIRHESLEMPPTQKLPDRVARDFEKWIELGAADPREGGASSQKKTVDLQKGREFWSFRPLTMPSIPSAGEGWARNDVDHFVAERQVNASTRDAETTFAPDADPDVVIRRLTYVLSGLAPTLDEQQRFAAAWASNPETAMEAEVDRLLASPRFGERWGRHWLDVARFAESTGGGRSMMLPDAWRFRDYVIRSMNNDKRFDQLIREHLAGDLLPALSDEQRDEQITGVGYLMLGAINYEEQDKEQLRMDVVDEQIDSLGRSFLGMTLGCCRCHDHKFDPVPTTDYYALAGIFRSTKSLTPGNVCGFVTAPLRIGFDKAAMEAWNNSESELQRRIAAAKNDSDANKAELQQLEDERKAHAKKKPEIPVVMCVEDEAQPADWHVHIRGEIRNPGPVVPRGFLTAATPDSQFTPDSASQSVSVIPAGTSGRRELAEWVASPQNPLTARVYVNRVWGYVMGEGLVRTADNFGQTGERPSHPELLDYLASRFIADGWSTKKLVRELCLSRTFRIASRAPAGQLERDSDNCLLTHAFRRRLDAESVRDTLLQISGHLDLSLTSGSTIAKVFTYDNEYQHSTYPLQIRSVFVPSFRNTLLDLFEIFDGANPNLVTGNRTRSTRPAQALYMLNSPFVIEQAQAAATTYLKSDAFHIGETEQNIRNVWRICVSREPTSEEIGAVLEIVSGTPESDEVWAEVFHALFASVDFRYLE